MASKRQIEANRKNAKRSTGPKTTAGKSRSCHNALRHGLARAKHEEGDGLEMPADSTWSGLPADLAREGSRLADIRLVRVRMLAELLAYPTAMTAKRIRALERYERNARRAQRRALQAMRSKG